MKTENGTMDLLTLMLVPGVRGGIVRRMLADRLKRGWTWEEFRRMPEEELRAKVGLPVESARVIANDRDGLAEEQARIVSALESIHAGVVSSEDPDYPAGLRRMVDYPALIFWKGNLGLLRRRKVGVLSSRNPPWRDVALVGRMIVDLRAAGAVLVSGAGAIQHYVPGYWGLLAKVPVIWVLDRGLLTALEGSAKGHIAPFARMDGRLWLEENELAISAFSPEDVGTPGGMQYRDRVTAFLSDDLVGWGVRDGGNALRVLKERHEADDRVVIAVRKPRDADRHRADAIPRLVVNESLTAWEEWLRGRRAAPPQLDAELIRVLRAFLKGTGNLIVLDVAERGETLGSLMPEEGDGALWARSRTPGARERGWDGTADILRMNENEEAALKSARKVLLVTGSWEEWVDRDEALEQAMLRALGEAAVQARGFGEPVRDYRAQSASEYRQAHAKLLEMWREIVNSARIANSRSTIPRALAVLVRAHSLVSPESELIWVCPSSEKPTWFERAVGGIGLRKTDDIVVSERWEAWVRMVREEGKT
jgi:hypothetical protein